MAEMLSETNNSEDVKIIKEVILKAVNKCQFMYKYKRITSGLWSTVLKYGIVPLNP